MVLVQQFRIFAEGTGQTSPWHRVKIFVKSVDQLPTVRASLGERVFVNPSDIDLVFIEVGHDQINTAIAIKANIKRK